MSLYNNQGQLCSFYSGKTKSAGLDQRQIRSSVTTFYLAFATEKAERNFHSVSMIILPFLKWRKDCNKWILISLETWACKADVVFSIFGLTPCIPGLIKSWSFSFKNIKKSSSNTEAVENTQLSAIAYGSILYGLQSFTLLFSWNLSQNYSFSCH